MLDIIISLEQNIVNSLGWPPWALRTIEVLSVFVLFLASIEYGIGVVSSTGKVTSPQDSKRNTSFHLFQLQYLSVYFTVMLADWLQGTNMYTLYSSYGVNIGALFLTGFLSSAVFGTFLGIYVDSWGRKFGCIIFCVLEIVINLVEHIPSMPLLLLGRVLGGLSTSLLFSAFESWMVSEHRKRGYPEEWLSSTFVIASWGNGIVAICAGFVAQIAADWGGDIGPFQVAILLTVVALFLILTWTENYGERNESAGSVSEASRSSGDSDDLGAMMHSIRSSAKVIHKYPVIFFLGMSQAFFEGAVYTFVFMWVPSMLELMQGGLLPTGLVFSAFMLSMTAGGMLFGLLLPIFPGGAVALCALVFACSACAMLVPIFCFEFWWVFSAFLVLEFMLGMFNSCGATLRSIYFPEGLQSSIMSIFRLPLNLLVVLGTLLTNSANGIDSLRTVFCVVVGMHVTAFVLQLCITMYPVPPSERDSTSTGKQKKTQ